MFQYTNEPPIFGALLSKAATNIRPLLQSPSTSELPLTRPDTECLGRQSGKSSLTTAAGLVHGTIFFCMSLLGSRTEGGSNPCWGVTVSGTAAGIFGSSYQHMMKVIAYNNQSKCKLEDTNVFSDKHSYLIKIIHVCLIICN